MSILSTEAIVTIISTIPGLIVSTLSAWFAYKALCRRNPAPHDVETLTLVQFDPVSRISSTFIPPSMPAVSSHSSWHQHPHPPPPLPPVMENFPGVFRPPERAVFFPESQK